MRTESQGQVTRRASARAALATMAAIGLMAAGGDALAQAKPLQKLRMTIPVPALVFYPIYVAQDKGFFADEGIEMEVMSTQGDGPDVDALIAGSVQFTASTPNRLLTAYEQGKPLKAVMSMSNKIGIHCFMNKESAEKAGIKEGMSFNEKIKRLKGLTLGGTRPGAMSYTSGRLRQARRPRAAEGREARRHRRRPADARGRREQAGRRRPASPARSSSSPSRAASRCGSSTTRSTKTRRTRSSCSSSCTCARVRQAESRRRCARCCARW